jgi:hypothetical protein
MLPVITVPTVTTLRISSVEMLSASTLAKPLLVTVYGIVRNNDNISVNYKSSLGSTYD